MFAFNAAVGVIVLLWLYFLWSRRKYYLLSWKLPGPRGYPFIGIGHKFLKQEDILTVLQDLEKKYSTPAFSWLGPIPFLIIAEPNDVEKILTSPNFLDKAENYHPARSAYGDGLFTASCPKWNNHRKLLQPAFSHKILISFLPIFNKEVDILNQKLRKYVGTGDFDISMLLEKCSLNTAIQTTMGKDMNFQSDENSQLLHCLHNYQEVITKRIFLPWLQSDFLFQFTDLYKKLSSSKVYVRNFVKNLIESKSNSTEPMTDTDDLRNSNNEVNITKNNNLFIDQLLLLQRRNDFTWEDVENESTVIVAAAFETTTTTINLIIMCLAMFPEYQERLFEEIESVCPEKEFQVTYEDTQHMVYMDMIINETMRVISPIPLVARNTMNDFEFQKDVILPKGTQVGIDIFHMHRSERIWGQKAKTFYPDHFLPENLTNIHPYAFIPFTKGIRNCVGWQYARLSMKVMLSKIIKNYRFATDFNFEDLQFLMDISLKLKRRPLLRVYQR